MLNLRKPHNRYWLAELAIGDPNGFGKPNDPLFTAPLVVQALVGGLGASVISGMMSDKGGSSPGPAPAVTPPTPMPTPGDADSQAAKRASIADQMRRRGRASTILTDPLSADSQGTKLGA